jgi:hypothetical protein
MWKKVSLIVLCFVIFTSIWFHKIHKEYETAAFNYAKEYVINQYKEDGNLTNGGARFDIGRGNYSIIVQNDKNKKYYIEVKLSNDLTLVSVEDDTSNIKSSADK